MRTKELKKRLNEIRAEIYGLTTYLDILERSRVNSPKFYNELIEKDKEHIEKYAQLTKEYCAIINFLDDEEKLVYDGYTEREYFSRLNDFMSKTVKLINENNETKL